ncbi:MAG: right-handed parallel beta-helix repeat-containing protein, partial [Candidatus Woesearchaeota archaeon]
MKQTKEIKKWFHYLEYLYNSGYSKADIKEHLKKLNYNDEQIILIFNEYKKEKENKKTTKIIISIIILFLFLTSVLFFKKPELTGNIVKIIGSGLGNKYYVDPLNGLDTNNGLSPQTAFKTLNYAFKKINSGDIIYLMDGTHYLNTSLNLNNKYFDNAVVITGLNQGKPILKANIQKFEFPNNVWQNVSFNNLNLWASDYDTTDTIFIAYYENRTNLFSYNKYEDLLNSSKPEGIYYNISNKKILIRFKDITKNPNQISLIISHRIPFYFTNVKGNGFVISGLNIEGAVRCAYIYGSDNILIENNTCVNGLKGFDVRGTSNITISNNLIYMKPGDFTWKDMKLSLMETSAIYMEDNLEDVNATFNEIYGYFNGILTYSKALDKFFNIDVSYNTIYDIYDDAIEIEDFCNKGSYHHNNISDVFVGFSLSPARALQNKCYIYNNLIIPDKNLKWDNKGNYYYGECYKIVDDLPAGYMDYHHNTCIGRGIYTTTTKTRTQVNSTWKNNIFFSNNQKLIEKSGLSIDGVFFDYNLYYRKDGNSIFKYWNSDTSTIEFSSLTSAKNSNQWDGKWDLNSLQTNPLFIDEANYDFRLRENSPACFMSDTNSYVGAFPCLNQNNNQNSQNNQENNSQEINN